MKRILAIFICFSVTQSSSATRVFNRVINGEIWKYIIDDAHNNFDTAVSWCNTLGGELPTIHSPSDFNFFADSVVVQYSPGPTSTWLGMKKTGNSCGKWLDGSTFDFGLTYSLGQSCSHCSASCCALKMWNNDKHKTVEVADCSNTARGVCVLKTLFLSDNNISQEFKKINSTITSNSNLLQQTIDSKTRDTIKEITWRDSRFIDRLQLLSSDVAKMKQELKQELNHQAESILESLFNQSSASGLNNVQETPDETIMKETRNFSAQIKLLRSDFEEKYNQSNAFMTRTSWMVYSLFIVLIVGLVFSILILYKRFTRVRKENDRIVHYYSEREGKL